MAESIPDGEKPTQAARPWLAPWRKMLTVMAGASLVFGALWFVVVLVGPLGPITANLTAAGLVLCVLVWVMLDLVVRTMAKRDRLRDQW